MICSLRIKNEISRNLKNQSHPQHPMNAVQMLMNVSYICHAFVRCSFWAAQHDLHLHFSSLRFKFTLSAVFFKNSIFLNSAAAKHRAHFRSWCFLSVHTDTLQVHTQSAIYGRHTLSQRSR